MYNSWKPEFRASSILRYGYESRLSLRSQLVAHPPRRARTSAGGAGGAAGAEAVAATEMSAQGSGRAGAGRARQGDGMDSGAGGLAARAVSARRYGPRRPVVAAHPTCG